MATLTGRTLGKYRVIERLGRGGMADVYKAYHPSLDRYVAIKVLHDFLSEGADFLARFRREARAVAALRHPHIVQVYDFDAEGELYYMVMEFVDGGTLKAKLQEMAALGERLPLSEVARIVRQVAEALDHAHAQGMLHRDVKPSNVVLDTSGRAFLTDFGVARIFSGTQFTASGALIGTPAYMSPEQGRGLPLTAATDIYSLGVVLYELVTGQAPFDADTPFAIIFMHVNDPLPLPSSLRSDIPEALERVILKALAKDPEDRYQSAPQMLLALQRAMTLESEAETVPQVLEWSDAPDIGTRVTEVLEAERLPEVDPSPGTATEQRYSSDLADAVTVVEEVLVPRPGAARPTAALQPRRRTRWLAILLMLAGVLVVGLILALALPKLFGEKDCSTIDECAVQATVLVEDGDYEGAVAWFDRALSLITENEQPEYAYLWCDRGEANSNMLRAEEASSDFERCVEWTQDAAELEWLRTWAVIQRHDLQATVLADEGDLAGALVQIDSALDRIPDDERPDYAYLWCRRGDLKSWMGYDEEAVSDFERCMEWSEGAVEFEWTRTWAGILKSSTQATVLEKEGDLEGAIDQLDRALDLVPEDKRSGYAHLMCHRGELNSWMGQIDEASSDFELCIEWAGEDAESQELRTWGTVLQYSARATRLREEGDLEGAVEQTQLALDVVPDDERPTYAYLWCENGDLYIGMEQIDEAMANFERCIEWTGGEAEFDEVRTWAEGALAELRER